MDDALLRGGSCVWVGKNPCGQRGPRWPFRAAPSPSPCNPLDIRPSTRAERRNHCADNRRFPRQSLGDNFAKAAARIRTAFLPPLQHIGKGGSKDTRPQRTFCHDIWGLAQLATDRFGMDAQVGSNCPLLPAERTQGLNRSMALLALLQPLTRSAGCGCWCPRCWRRQRRGHGW